MNPSPQAVALDPATLDAMLATTFAVLPHRPDASDTDIAMQREAARVAVLSLHPRDPMEAELAIQAMAAHYGAMECFRRAALANLPDAVMLRCHGRAVALCRLFADTAQRLRGLQARPSAFAVPAQPQPVVAEAAPAVVAPRPEQPRAASLPAQPAARPAPPPALSQRGPVFAPPVAPPAAPPLAGKATLDPMQTRLLDEIASRAMTAIVKSAPPSQMRSA